LGPQVTASEEDPRDDVRDPQQHVFCHEAFSLGADGEQMGCPLQILG